MGKENAVALRVRAKKAVATISRLLGQKVDGPAGTVVSVFPSDSELRAVKQTISDLEKARKTLAVALKGIADLTGSDEHVTSDWYKVYDWATEALKETHS